MRPISAESAQACVARALGFGEQTPPRTATPALCAEALRAALWAEWAAASQPVYVTRLINAAARMLLPWKECAEDDAPADDEQLRTACAALDRARDRWNALGSGGALEWAWALA